MPCRRFEEPTGKGKQRAEDEGKGEGASKRPRVGLTVTEWMEQRQAEVEDPQVGS